MTNHYAEKINNKLGVVLFDVSCTHRLKLIKFSKKQIKEMSIDDLINDRGQGTDRLGRLVREILFTKETK